MNCDVDYMIYYIDSNGKVQSSGYCNYCVMLKSLKKYVEDDSFRIIAINECKNIKQQALEDAGI